MSKKPYTNLIVWVLVLAFAVVALLWLVKPVYGLLAVVVLVLAYNLVITLSPLAHQAVTDSRIAWKGKLRRLFSKTKTDTQPNTTGAFVPSHYLVNQQINPPVYCLVDKDSFLIGRDAGCDLQLPGEVTVSGQHCKITYFAHARQYNVVDLRSAMGTFVGTKRLEANTPERLPDEAVLSISNLKFRFTRIPGGKQGDQKTSQQILDMAGTKTGEPGMMLTFAISYGGKTQNKSAIVGSTFTIGRSASCNLVLSGDDSYASSLHAALSIHGGQVYLTDLGSKNGVFVGEQRIPVKQAVPLKDHDMIRIGRHHLQVLF